MSNHDLLDLNPVQEYTPPALPALADKPPLEKLPTRWKKNAAVVACVGIVGGMTLASCAGPLNDDRLHNGGGPVAPYYVTQPTEQEAAPFVTMPAEETELDIRVHHGGEGGAPFYIAYLTEQEAMGIIRAQLEAAGLRFDATPPAHDVVHEMAEEWRFNSVEAQLDLYDAGRNVAISVMNDGSPWAVEQVTEQFAQQLEDTTVGVFYNPGETVGWGECEWSAEPANPPTEEAKLEAVPVLRENLTEQVQTFIEFLQTEGIL